MHKITTRDQSRLDRILDTYTRKYISKETGLRPSTLSNLALKKQKKVNTETWQIFENFFNKHIKTVVPELPLGDKQTVQVNRNLKQILTKFCNTQEYFKKSPIKISADEVIAMFIKDNRNE